MLICIAQEKLEFDVLQRNRIHRKWKWTYKLDIWPPCNIQKNRWDICQTFFSDFWCNFLPQEGVFHKCSKSKYHCIHQNKFFGTHFVCEKHPLHVFCFLPPLEAKLFKKKWSPNSWGVKKAPCKKFHVFGENWQRNQFPKLTNLWLIFHSCYNFAIVHWEHWI